MRYGRNLDFNERTLKVETALAYDAVQLFAKAMHELDRSQDVVIKPLNCSRSDTWIHGNSLINYMKMVEMEGLSGFIKFDPLGLRTSFHLDVVELNSSGIITVGSWNNLEGANFTRNPVSILKEDANSLVNKTLIVTTILSNPYTMLKESSEMLVGNDRFEGFGMDIVDEISKLLGFNYTVRLVADGKWGNIDQHTGEWNGMIRELLDKKADMAIADLSINYERQTAVDFTMPFMNTGISLLYKKPQKKPPNLFSFLSPLSLEVWIYMITGYMTVSLVLFGLSRITPYEWNNPHPCNQNPDVLETNFTLVNSMWFTIGSIMQQGSDIAPKAVSTRMVAGTWWFFTLIMISTYTANLAAFLTVERMESPIESVDDLAKQTKIKYGIVGTGTTFSFFRDTQLPVYKRMWNFMESAKPTVFMKSNGEGVERVQKANGQYAFLMESASLEYFTERKCDITQIGGQLDSKGYGIALQQNSPYRNALTQAVLKLQETNRLLILKNKWWKEKRGGGACLDCSVLLLFFLFTPALLPLQLSSERCLIGK
uniref:Glutamate receptor 1 n=1 Tax=Lynceus sp. MCZ IZ 141354 TaxID=1930659 RepID=A0A9N6WQV2_9CRUS|nr:EOG090X00ST [Lynceus sp. MCZ IZ 141354]